MLRCPGRLCSPGGVSGCKARPSPQPAAFSLADARASEGRPRPRADSPRPCPRPRPRPVRTLGGGRGPAVPRGRLAAPAAGRSDAVPAELARPGLQPW